MHTLPGEEAQVNFGYLGYTLYQGKKAITKELRDRYQRASKKEKTMMLNEFIRLSGHSRCHACQILKKKKERQRVFFV